MLLNHFGQCERRHLERKAARLQHAALHFFGALAEMRVARIDVAPRVDHGDDRLAGIVGARIAHLRNARVMAEAAHVGFAEPTVRTQLLRFLATHRSVTIVVLAIDYIRGWSDRRIEGAGKVSVFRWQPDRTNTPFGSIGSRYSRVAKAWRPRR